MRGGDPEQILQRYGTRIHMLHLKDFKAVASGDVSKEPVPTEMGRGVLDYAAILSGARRAAIQHVFVEQEGFDVPWVESLGIDADWLRQHS